MRYKVVSRHTAPYAIIDERDGDRIVAKADNQDDADKVAEGLNLVEEQDQYMEEMGQHHNEMMADYFDDIPF